MSGLDLLSAPGASVVSKLERYEAAKYIFNENINFKIWKVTDASSV